MLQYNAGRATTECSVRELCALALRGGDLARGGYRAFFAASGDGGEQSALYCDALGCMPGWERDVPLCHATLFEGETYTVAGEVPFLRLSDEGAVSEQVFSLRGGAFYMTPGEVQWAQLLCFGHFLCETRGMAQVTLRLTFIEEKSGKVRHHERVEDAAALTAFYGRLLSRVKPWAMFAKAHGEGVLSAAGVRFPFGELREGQEELIHTVYRTIRTGKRLFAQAPTGIGKTVSVLYPSVRALGEGRCDKIFYLTAKTSTASEAFRAMRRLFEAGAQVYTVMVTAKEQMCTCPGYVEEGRPLKDVCNSIDCPFSAGYYDRVDGAIFELLGAGHGFSRNLIAEVAKKHCVCPYELSLELVELCDVIICDYNYVFDPAVRLRRCFGAQGDGENYVFLVDEAHNLPDRARDIYSAALTTDVPAKLIPLLPPEAEATEALVKLVRLMRRRGQQLCVDTLRRGADGVERGYCLSRAPVAGVAEAAHVAHESLRAWLWDNRDFTGRRSAEQVLDMLSAFLLSAGLYDEHFTTYLEVEGEKVTQKLYCLDPSALLDGYMRRARASVLFSATLTPADYFVDVLGGGRGAISLTLPSPFEREKLCVAVMDHISTRYEDREKSRAAIVSAIAATVSGRVGNYIVYFPSYAYMEDVLRLFERKYPKVPVIVQKRGMSHRGREEFLARFADDDRHLRVGFCVLGGSFSEGVDLPGKRLIGTVIVGVGIPGLSNERNILRDYFESTRERGYDYAYTYPGMNRVLQAAGRVIRRTEDEGVVVLIDDRYATPAYRSLFPDAWEDIKFVGNAISLSELVKRFWKSRKNTD